MQAQIREILQRHESAINQIYSSPTIPTSAPMPSSADGSLSHSPSIFSPNIPRSDNSPYLHRSYSTPTQPFYNSSVTSIVEPHTPPTSQLGGSYERRIFGYGARDQEYLEMLTNFQDHKKVPMHIATSNGPVLGFSTSPEFPDYDLCYTLCDLYFKHINDWIPILHREVTLDLLFTKRPLAEAEGILLHAIIVTALRFSTDNRLTPEVRKQQHKTSTEKVQLYGLRHSTVIALQALVIVTLDQIGESNGPPGWNMIALIARSAVHLGLNVEPTSPTLSPAYPSIYTLRAIVLPEPKDFIEDESRRRLLWAIYLLDRYATVGMFNTPLLMTLTDSSSNGL
jgi:hypothetical protein